MSRARLDPRRWLDQTAVLEKHGRILVVRDDVLEGGTKLRFLPFLTQGAKEIVYGTPFCGGAQLALAVLGRESGQRVTLFTAQRKRLHARQLAAQARGAHIVQVPFGYMTNVQAKARAYAKESGALFLPLGFDVPEAREPFLEAIRRVRRRSGSPDEVWCATGSGMLARSLAEGFPSSKIVAVGVGLKSRHLSHGLHWPRNAEILESVQPFEQEEKERAPFPCDGNYDRKAWAQLVKHQKPGRSYLFWNVMSPHHAEDCVGLGNRVLEILEQKRAAGS